MESVTEGAALTIKLEDADVVEQPLHVTMSAKP
jgi:hypothetical protein